MVVAGRSNGKTARHLFTLGLKAAATMAAPVALAVESSRACTTGLTTKRKRLDVRLLASYIEKSLRGDQKQTNKILLEPNSKMM